MFSLGERLAPNLNICYLPEDLVDSLSADGKEKYFGILLQKSQFEAPDKHLIKNSLELSKKIHLNDVRTNGPFIDHPIRVALTAMRYFDGVGPDVIAACLLHDTVEKNPSGLVNAANNDNLVDSCEVHDNAFSALESLSNEKIKNMVRNVTNPKSIHKSSKITTVSKNIIYKKHVRNILNSDSDGAGSAVVKFCDFIDNFVGNHKTIGPLQIKLDVKYSSLCLDYKNWLNSLSDAVICDDNKLVLNELIDNGYESCKGRMRTMGRNAVSTAVYSYAN